MNTNTPTINIIHERALALETTVSDALDRYRDATSDLERIVSLSQAIRSAGRYPSLVADIKSLWASATAGAPRIAIRDLKKGDRFISCNRVYEMRMRGTGCSIITQHGPLHFEQARVVYYEPASVEEPEDDAALRVSKANRAVRKARKSIRSCKWSGGRVPQELHDQLDVALAEREAARTQGDELDARITSQRNLERAVSRREEVADQLFWALESNRPEAQIQQIEERLDVMRSRVRVCMEELVELDARVLADADASFARANPEPVFDEVLQAGASLEVLKKRGKQLEVEMRKSDDDALEREWRSVRAAIHMVTTAPEWCERAEYDAEVTRRYEHSLDTFRREPTRVGLMSLAEVA